MKKKQNNFEKGRRICQNISGLFLGAILLALGIIFLLQTLGLINIAVWGSFKYYWPVGLILAGTAFLFRARGIGWIFIIATIILGMMTGWSYAVSECGEPRSIEQKISMDPEIEKMDIELDFGAGEVDIGAGDNQFLAVNNVETSDKKDPEFVFEKSGSTGRLSIQRHNGCFLGDSIKQKWNLGLAPGIPKTLKMDYGAANVNMDLRKLFVERVELDTGASSTEITFDSYPTKAVIETGASDMQLFFPKDAGVKISIDSGATSTDLEGFTKNNNSYYSENYEASQIKINVSIDAGASSIKASFY